MTLLASRALRGLALALCATHFGCGSTVVIDPDADGGADGDGETDGNDGGDDGAGTGDVLGTEPYGIPCRYLVGEATLVDWDGEEATYASSGYSFQFASQDVDVTHNDWDLMHQDGAFVVNTVTDDTSYVVDLGPIELEQVPATVDLAEHPLGKFGDHDWLAILLDHTYYVRTLDGDSRQVVAVRVVGHEPGVNVRVAWMRSLEADQMTPPVACLDP